MSKSVTTLATALFVAALSPAASGERVEASVDNDGIQRLSVLAGGYFFRPDHIVVKADRPVELAVSKEPGLVPHAIALRIPAEKIDLDEDLGTEPRTIRFTIRQPGRYDFSCSKKLLFFESHREKGMEGVLEVVE
ncbi:MAG: quinol oxidase [Gammaproteobacteria bacterium]|nr:MAG: quinol oxidase [Gammaproteobacteria bacterium]